MYSRQVESFVETAKAGSFSKAARRLYIAPSSLIQQIDLLEQRLDVVLFERGRRGVRLTEAGESLYRDAVDIVRRADEAVARARLIQRGEGSLRVATSLLMKCRMLPGIWSRMIEEAPGTRIDIISLESAGVEPGNYLRGLGVAYDAMEGLYLSEVYRGRCQFLELARTPIQAALPQGHELFGRDPISLDDLRRQTIVMLQAGASEGYDDLRRHLRSAGDVEIVDAAHYDMDIFSLCEMKGFVLMSPRIWEDIHPQLVPHRIDHDAALPYGIICPLEPRPAMGRMMDLMGRCAGSAPWRM